MNTIKDMLGEGGSISSMRVLMFIVVLAMIVPPVLYAVRNNQPEVAINWTQLAMVLGAMGVKAFQKFGETKQKEEA